MLRESDFEDLKDAPNFDELELPIWASALHRLLVMNTFKYNCIDEKGEDVVLVLSFSKPQIPHLCGFQNFIPARYSGNEIMEKIENGEWGKTDLKAFDHSKSHGNWKDAKKKMRYLSTVYSLLSTASVIHFIASDMVEPTNIQSSFLLTEIVGSSYVHLGIDGPESDEKYFPRTLLIENSDKFIKNQTFYMVKEIGIYDKRSVTSKDIEEISG